MELEDGQVCPGCRAGVVPLLVARWGDLDEGGLSWRCRGCGLEWPSTGNPTGPEIP